jgi:signal peptidase I
VIHFENNDATVLFDPVDLLTSNSTYTFFVTTEITDLQGLNMENRCEIVFSTGNNMSNGKIINVPGDVETIQGGIDFANPGDIVLVKPGTYYENINFKGKAITVASRFLVDGDTSC